MRTELHHHYTRCLPSLSTALAQGDRICRPIDSVWYLVLQHIESILLTAGRERKYQGDRIARYTRANMHKLMSLNLISVNMTDKSK